jgi:hypothetical protein
MSGFAIVHWLIIAAVFMLMIGGPLVVLLVVYLVFRPKAGSNLYPCPSCGRLVSRLAASCPQCGSPLQQQESFPKGR